eukprot:gene20357-24841_t
MGTSDMRISGRLSTGLAVVASALSAASLAVAAEPMEGLATLKPLTRAELKVETIATGLDHPWSIAQLPDGDLLVTERVGRLRRIHTGKLDSKPIAGVPAVYVMSQAGLFDVVLHPDY